MYLPKKLVWFAIGITVAAFLAFLGALIFECAVGKPLTVAFAQILAGCIAGVLTVLGVVLTINHQEKVRKDEARAKLKPYFCKVKTGDPDIVSVVYKTKQHIECKSEDVKDKPSVRLHNYSDAICIVEKISIECVDYFDVSGIETIIPPHEKILFDIWSVTAKRPGDLTIKFYARDIIGTNYIFYVTKEDDTPNDKKIKSISALELVKEGK